MNSNRVQTVGASAISLVSSNKPMNFAVVGCGGIVTSWNENPRSLFPLNDTSNASSAKPPSVPTIGTALVVPDDKGTTTSNWKPTDRKKRGNLEFECSHVSIYEREIGMVQKK